MRILTGDMWTAYDKSSLFCITTNSTMDGRPGETQALVMGAGIARQAKERFPGIETAFGAAILATQSARYGLLVSPSWPVGKLAAFQTKILFSAPAELDLIIQSAEMLAAWCVEHPGQRVDLNAPGVGYGKLPWHDVMGAIGPILPTQVNVWSDKPWHQRFHWTLDAEDLKDLKAVGKTADEWRSDRKQMFFPDPDTFFYADGGTHGYAMRR